MVEFRIEGDDCPLAEATRTAPATADAQPPLLREDRNVLLRFSAPPDEGLGEVLDDDGRIRYLHRTETDSRHNYRCLSMQPCVVHDLISAGFLVESLTYQGGNAVLTGTVVGQEVLRGVMETAGDLVGVQLKRAYALRTDDDEGVARQWDLTPAQEESLRHAVEAGYFTVPRGATADEVAERLGISKSAFLERLHRGQNGLLAQLFDVSPPAPGE
ncbi:MAG: helix-turn-helix domain-containing protein [Salinirussus sp.]